MNNFDDGHFKFTSVISFTYCRFPSYSIYHFSFILLNPFFYFPFHFSQSLQSVIHAVNLYAGSMNFSCLIFLFYSVFCQFLRFFFVVLIPLYLSPLVSAFIFDYRETVIKMRQCESLWLCYGTFDSLQRFAHCPLKIQPVSSTSSWSFGRTPYESFSDGAPNKPMLQWVMCHVHILASHLAGLK